MDQLLSEIVDNVSRRTGVPRTRILGKSRRAPVARARQQVYLLACQLGFTLEHIAAQLGRAHPTVLAGRNRALERMVKGSHRV